MGKFVAVDGLTIEPQGIVDIASGSLTVSTTPSQKVKVNGSGVYFGGIDVVVVGANATGYDPGTVVSIIPITIEPLSVSCKSDGDLVNREDDISVDTAPNMTGTISGTPTPFLEVFKITDPNQDNVLSK